MTVAPYIQFRSLADKRTINSAALVGLFGAGNLGNDGSMEALLDFLRKHRPDLEAHCISVDPELIGKRHRIRTLRLNWRLQSRLLSMVDRLTLKVPSAIVDLAYTLRSMRRFDVLIAPGTGLLDDFGTGPRRWPYTLFKWCLAARLSGKQIWFVSIGAGPIHHPLSRWLMKSAARMAHFRSYRDTLSREYMEGIGFDVSKDEVYPDIAFNLTASNVPSRPNTSSESITIGVGVMSYHGWHGWAEGADDIYDAYMAKLNRFVLWLLNQGYNVRLLMGETSDRSAIDKLENLVRASHPRLPEERLSSVPATSLHELMDQIAGTDVVVATRFHNIVCALKMGKPSISLGYALKNDVLMAEMGMGDYCHHVERFDVDELIGQFTRILSRRCEHEKAIAEQNRAFAAALKRQDAELLARLL